MRSPCVRVVVLYYVGEGDTELRPPCVRVMVLYYVGEGIAELWCPLCVWWCGST